MTGRNIELSIGQLAEEALHRGPVAIPPPCACLQPGGFHETCNTLSGDADATLLQGSVNARRAIGALAGVEDGANLRQQRFVFRSEEHTSELQSLMRNSYAVFCLTKKTQKNSNI